LYEVSKIDISVLGQTVVKIANRSHRAGKCGRTKSAKLAKRLSPVCALMQ